MAFGKMLGGLVSAGVGAINRYMNKDKKPVSQPKVVQPASNNSPNSYAYDPQGNRHDTFLSGGVTTTTDGNRIGAGWTSQTAGGVYKMGADGKGVKVDEHNKFINQNSNPYISDKDGSYLDKFNHTYLSPTYTKDNPQKVSSMLNRDFFTDEQLSNAQRPDERWMKDNYGDRFGKRHGSPYGTLYASHNPNDMEEYNKLVIRTPDGRMTTVDREHADYYAQQGYEILAPARGSADWNIKEALRNDRAGENWVDDGYNSGMVMLRKYNEDGKYRTSTTHARYAESKLNDGWELSPESQSINRALQSGKHAMTDAINNSIKGGQYNSDYSGMYDNYGYEDGKFKFDGDGRDSYSNFGNQSIQENKQSQIENNKSITKLPSGEIVEKKGNGQYTVTGIDGQNIDVKEEQYIDYLLQLNGFNPVSKKKDKIDGIASAENHVETSSAEAKAIQAKLEVESGKAIKVNKEQVNSFLDSAKSMIGYSYSQSDRMGNSSVDCSSLVGRAMKMAGITDNPQVTTASMTTDKRFTKIKKSEARPGDIMWQKGHVAIFLGDNKVLEASSSKNKVVQTNLNNRFEHAYRINDIV